MIINQSINQVTYLFTHQLLVGVAHHQQILFCEGPEAGSHPWQNQSHSMSRVESEPAIASHWSLKRYDVTHKDRLCIINTWLQCVSSQGIKVIWALFHTTKQYNCVSPKNPTFTCSRYIQPVYACTCYLQFHLFIQMHWTVLTQHEFNF